MAVKAETVETVVKDITIAGIPMAVKAVMRETAVMEETAVLQ